MTVTKEQLKAGLEVLKALADCIRELGSVPSGELYARVMGTLTLDQYMSCIQTLKRTGLVKESGHLLTWIEPNA